MKRLLTTDEYPHAYDLGAVLQLIRDEVRKGSYRMTHDGNPQTRHLLGAVLASNEKVMDLLNRAGDMIEGMGLASAGNAGAPVVVPLRAVDQAHRRNRLC